MKSVTTGASVRFAASVTVLATLLFAFCGNLSLSHESGGSSSEVVAIVGNALYADGTAAAHATIRLRPADYLAGVPAAARSNTLIADVITDSGGAFRIDSIPPGNYALEIADLKSAGAVRAISATVDSEEIHLAPMSLKPLSKIAGTARLPSGTTGPVYVMVYGLERRVIADSMGGFAFNDLPEGQFTLRISPAAPVAGPCDVPKITTTAGSSQTIDTVTLHTFAGEDYSTWAYSRIVRINTSSSGANVATAVPGFPLLVRLDASNFDFTSSLAYKPGTDIRFASAGGKHLPCQIERWDPVLHKAEIWVRVDTVFGNDSAQSITLYCGKAAAASWTGNSSVFDTAAGFAAVWHLGDDLDDATANGNTGTEVKTAVAEGLIGACRYFNGSSSFIGIDSSASLNMSGKGPTILLWERSSQVYTNERMFFEHDVWPNTGDYGFSTRSNTTLSFDFPSADSEVRYSGKPMNDDSWHLIAATLDDQSNTGVIYYDGDSVAGGPMRSEIGSSKGRSFIGSRGGMNRFFEGYIDEMWIVSRPLTGEFIKLIYENQRQGQRLVSIE